MPSDFLTPFLEVDEEFCKNIRGLGSTDGLADASQQQTHRVLGFQRRHSLCPVTLPNSKFNSISSDVANAAESACWGLNMASSQQWHGENMLPRSSLNHIPFRVDRSVSMIEGSVAGMGVGEETMTGVLLPPPGLSLSNASLSSSSFSSSSSSSCSTAPKTVAPSPPISTRYKTELCRTYEESGACKYGVKCQFAHGIDELRGLSRHPKYKTEPCRTFHTIGFCPYGARCHFIHNADEAHTAAPVSLPRQKPRPPLLRQSVSFAGFSSSQQVLTSGFWPVQESHTSAFHFVRASSVSPPPSSTGSPELLSPLFPEPGPLKHCPYPFTAIPEPASEGADAAPRFYAVTDSVNAKCPVTNFTPKSLSLNQHPPTNPPLPSAANAKQRPLLSSLSSLPVLQRCSSADSLSEEGYTSSCSLSSSSSSGANSPSLEGRRLPIFSRLSLVRLVDKW